MKEQHKILHKNTTQYILQFFFSRVGIKYVDTFKVFLNILFFKNFKNIHVCLISKILE